MAGDWIKMRTSLDTDPAVVRIASGLNTDRYAVIGRLHRIWSWASEHSIDGQDVPVDAVFLDELVATPGFSAQLRSVGWLSGRDGSLCFPRFERHNGESAKQRALDAERKRLARKASATCPDANRTKAGPEERREEKRRVTKKTNKKGSYSESFSRWWNTYPRRIAKDAAFVAYEKAISAIVAREDVEIEVAQSMLQAWTAERVEHIAAFEVQYQPHPATWLNNGRYYDEVPTPKSRVASIEELEAWTPQ